MLKIVLSEFVEDDLEVIWRHIALDNRSAADRFLIAANETFRLIATMPYMGRIRNFPHSRLLQLRSFRVKGFESYLIFYEPFADSIKIFHVLHGARNLDEFWKD